MSMRPMKLFIFEVRLCVPLAPEFTTLPGVVGLKTEDGQIPVLIQPEVKHDGREFEWHRVSLSFEPDEVFDPRSDRGRRLAFLRACKIEWKAHEKRLYHEYRERVIAAGNTAPSFSLWRTQFADMLDEERTNFLSGGVRFKEVRNVMVKG